MDKLSRLADLEGCTAMELLEEASADSIAAGICTNPGCDYQNTVEPDCMDGYCENCGTQTVSSCLILAGII